MEKIDLKKDLKNLYNPSSKEFQIIKVPKMNFLMIDGSGDPNTSKEYASAIEALYAVSYTIKFMVKKQKVIDYVVMPLEGLWWAENMSAFLMKNKQSWKWTSLIMQPDFVDRKTVDEAIKIASAKKDLPGMAGLRFESFEEGLSVQIMYFGPYSEEEPTIEEMHKFILDTGFKLRGKHHEIYLSDPRKTAPEKIKTVIRQPISEK